MLSRRLRLVRIAMDGYRRCQTDARIEVVPFVPSSSTPLWGYTGRGSTRQESDRLPVLHRYGGARNHGGTNCGSPFRTGRSARSTVRGATDLDCNSVQLRTIAPTLPRTRSRDE